MTDVDATCVASHRLAPERARRVVPGTNLCHGCTVKLARALRGLPVQYAALEARLVAGGGGGQPRVSGTPVRTLPINPSVVELRTEIAHTLSWWAVYVTDRYQIAPPRNASPEATGSILTAQLPRLATEPWVGDLVAATGLLWRRARSALDPSGRRRRELMPCPEDTCTGTIYAHMSISDSLLPGVIRCSAEDKHEWPADRWLTLGRKIHRADRPA